jgi:NADH:ubiquinone oxidoreductase subunit 4 (subunit M)
MYQRVFYGKIRLQVNLSLPDVGDREKAALWPTALAALAMGVAPLFWLNAIDPAVRMVLSPLARTTAHLVAR